MSSRIWTNDTRRDEGEEKGRRAQNRRLPDTKVRNRGQQAPLAPRTRARQELVSLPVQTSTRRYACMHTMGISLYVFLCMRYVRYVTVNSQCSPADGTHTRQTETSQPVSAATQTLVPSTPPHNPTACSACRPQ